MEKYAIIVAGGMGLRMKSDIPKQFIPIAGLPVLMHTLNAFSTVGGIQIILVLPKNQLDYWIGLCIQYHFVVQHKLVVGGETRFHSVRNGLDAIDNQQSLVAIHDGVRPLIEPELIEKSFEMAAESGNSIMVIPLKDSIRQVDLLSNKSVNRNNYYLVQTPQTFKTNLIVEAYSLADHFNFTDDAGVLEESGHSIHLLEGDAKNIKITNAEDVWVAELFIKSKGQKEK